MQANLSGVHTATKRLASGVIRAYAYAYRNGPSLAHADGNTDAEAYKNLRKRLGTPEVLAALHDAMRPRNKRSSDVRMLCTGFLASPEFTKLSKDTKRDYRRYVEAFRDEFGHYSLKIMENRPGAAGDVLSWRDEAWAGKPASMDHCVASLSALFAWGRNRRLTTAAPFAKVARVHDANRADKIWDAKQIEAFCVHASPTLAHIVLFTSETCLRQSDVLTLTWSDLRLDHDYPHLIRRAKKTKRQIVVPLTALALDVLQNTPKRQLTVFTNTHGKTWTPDGFRTSFRRACRRAGITELDFHDLRGTGITKLVLLGVGNDDIARIVGWSSNRVDALLNVYVGASQRDVDMLARIKQKRDSTNR